MKCKLLIENASEDDVKNPDIPTDSFIVHYKKSGSSKEIIDICRGSKMVDVFDFYYDKHGKGSINKITFSNGKINPRMWNVPKPEEKEKPRARK